MNITPVETHNGTLFKREDLYDPYGPNFITGGKVRQCRHLIENNLDYIRNECGGTIATAASIHSPQSVIVSRVAKEYGLKSIIGFGNTTIEKALKLKSMQTCSDLGSELIVLSETQGYSTVLYSNLNKLAKTRPMFKVLFGYAAQKYRTSIVDKIAEQVENVECDTLYVPLGSGMTFVGILEGILRYKKSFRVVALQPFGYDRRKSIHSYLSGMSWEYKYEYHTGTYPYNKLFKKNVGFELDMIYESKAFDMVEKMILPGEVSCFWVIGNSNCIRDI
tara:strand:+ start:917 stop:1747 length:831 start_codon:yes stop_codon:yes gene_type:complete